MLHLEEDDHRVDKEREGVRRQLYGKELKLDYGWWIFLHLAVTWSILDLKMWLFVSTLNCCCHFFILAAAAMATFEWCQTFNFFSSTKKKWNLNAFLMSQLTNMTIETNGNISRPKTSSDRWMEWEKKV